jgi:hypothetical protein
MMDPLIGQTPGQYELQDRLGRGGRAAVNHALRPCASARTDASPLIGIRGGILLGRAVVEPDVRAVLNAFRHQRRDHQAGTCLWAVVYKCSTPFGIRGFITGLSSTRRDGEHIFTYH